MQGERARSWGLLGQGKDLEVDAEMIRGLQVRGSFAYIEEVQSGF